MNTTLSLRDAATGRVLPMRIAPDAHGCVVSVGETDVVVDLAAGRLRVFVCERQGEVRDGPLVEIPVVA